MTDVLIVNRREARTVMGIDPESAGTIENLALAVRSASGIPAVVVTLGGDWAVASEIGGDVGVRGLDVTVVDTVGAGDAFAGALVAEIARGLNMREALPFANAAGAVAVTRVGGAGSLPTRTEIEGFRDNGR